MISLAERLANKIREETGREVSPLTFSRTYAGRNMKAAGAFVWMVQDINGIHWYGSMYPASECVKKKYKLVLGEGGEIFPEEKEK